MSINTFKKLSVRLVALLIALIMIIGLLPVTALADESTLPFTLKYKVGEDGEELTADAEVVGTVQEPTGGTGTAYVVSLPYGSQVTSYSSNAYRTTYGSKLTSPSGSLDQIAGSYVENGEMAHPTAEISPSYSTMLGYVAVEEGTTWLEEENVKGFSVFSTFFGQSPGAVVIVQISTEAPAADNQDIQLGTDGTNLGDWAELTLYSVEVPDSIDQITFKSDGELGYFCDYDGAFDPGDAALDTSYVMSLDEDSPFLVGPTSSIYTETELQPKGVVYSETEPLYFVYFDTGIAYVIRVTDSDAVEDPVDPVTVDTDRNAYNVVGTVATKNVYQVTAPEGTTKVSFTSPAGNYMALSKADGSGNIVYMKEIPLKEEYRFTQAMVDAVTNATHKSDLQTLYDSVSALDGYDYYLFKLFNNGAGLGDCYYLIRVEKPEAPASTIYTIDIDDEAGRQSFNMGSTPVFMIEVPTGTKGVNFISSDESNSLAQALDTWTGNADNGFIEQLTQGEGEDIHFANLDSLPRDLSEEDWGDIAVALKQLPAGDYYFFSIYDAKETYPAYFIKLAEPVRTVLAVEDTEGNAYELTELRTPPTLTVDTDTWPVDFVEGVYTVTVPKDTEDLRIALGDLSNVAEGEDPETYAFFSKWGGMLTGSSAEKIWHLDPLFIDWMYLYGTPSYEGVEADGILDYVLPTPYADGYYTLPMSSFALDPNNLDEYQTEVYGALDPDCNYAEVYVGTLRQGGWFDFATLLLVKFEDPSYMSGPAWVQLTDGTNVEEMKLPGISTIVMGGTEYPFDQASGFYKLVVPEGTETIQLKLNDSLTVPEEGDNPIDHYYIGRRGDISGRSSGGVPIAGDLYLGTTVSGNWYASENALNKRLEGVTRTKPRENITNSTITNAISDGWFTLSLSEFAYDTTATDNLGAYGSLDTDATYAEIQLQYVRTNNSDMPFGAMLLIQIGGNQDAENITPVRKEGVSAAVTETLDELNYSIDLSAIFEDFNGDAMTYKVKKSTDSEYTTLTGSVFSCVYDGRDVTFQFTASDGFGDGAIYKVTLTGTLLGMIRAADAIVADSGGYWTEYDFYLNPTNYMRNDYAPGNDLSSGYYNRMLNELQEANTAYAAYGNSGYSASSARDDLKIAISRLLTKDRVNVSRLWLAVTVAEKRMAAIGDYTEVTIGGLDTALEAAKAVYTDELYLSAYDVGLQAQIDEKADALLAELDELVNKAVYKTAYDTYRARKDEASDLLALCDLANFHESDYTVASWQAFVDAYNALKADLDYKITGDGGTTDDYKMVKDFAKHIDALQDARNNLVSDRDITVSFSYINNFAALYPAIRTSGTDIYSNTALQLERGATTVYGAIQDAGLVFDKVNIYRIVDGRAIQDGVSPLLLVYVNGVNYGSIALSALENGSRVIQLHDGDQIKVVRIPTPVVKSEASSGYDTTEIFYSATYDVTLYKDSIAVISFESMPEGAQVGDKTAFTASVAGGYATNLNQAFSAEGLSLYVSGPSETEAFSQNLVKTTALTGEDGSLTYIFTQPGWYTVAMLNARQEMYTFTNVYGETTYGSYGSVYAGDFALVYIAPADDEDALIIAQRTENLAKAEAYYRQFHDYDFSGAGYAVFTDTYNALVSNQNSAQSFKALVDGFDADYAAMESYTGQYAMDHAALIQTLRGYLQYVPNDLSKLDYTYKNIINNIQSRYRALNGYQKTLLSRNETARLETLLEINTANLYTPDAVSITVEKDAAVDLPSTYGNLASAPNENRVYVIYPDGSKGETYYQWKTGGYDGMEPSCAGMTAYPGNQIRVRRIITQSEDAYWLVYSLDGGDTWKLMALVDGGATSPMVMLKAEFIMPEIEGTSLTIQYKTVSKTVYEEMCLGEGTPEMALEEAKAAYKAALVEVFASYDPARYTEDSYIDIRDAKNNGLDNIDSAKEVTFAAKALNAAIEAMKAVPVKDEVHVVVRTDVYSVADGAAWDGVLVDKWVAIDSESTMMSAIQYAVESSGYTGVGFESGYISDINGLGEFGGGRGSGWMGTLNDWFTNEGFTQFTVANGKLKAGDLVCIEYTCALGADIRGGVEGNTDTSLYELSLSGGTLTPVFDEGTVDYLFTLNDDAHATMVEFSANNRSFQARSYLNTYAPSAAGWISTGDTIPVQSGDIIYIGVGESAWAAMGSGDATVYTIAVVDDSGAAAALIGALPDAAALTYEDKADVDRANAVYQSLSDDRKAALSDPLKDKLAACIERIALLKAVGEVQESIEALPDPKDLTVANQFVVAAAKAQFDALGSAGQDDLPVISINKLEACVEKMAELVAGLDVDDIFNATGAYLASLGTPGVGSIGGEWLVVGLLRAGYAVPEGWAEGYYANAITYINENMNAQGQLHSAKSTDNSRMILALTALGKDVTNVGGKNLLTALADLDYVKKQGINGPIWALIAFDSHDYTIPTLSGSGTQTTRGNLIATILGEQLADGGWALSGINADPDMTAMALQALAPYYSTNAAVKTAVDKALAKLSAMQDDTGGYGSWGTVNSESCAQVIVALSALGINPDTDSRFVKNGCSVVDALYTYYVDGGGFRHILSGSRDGMASEQAYYALAAYYRLLTGATPLYDMSDVQLSATDPAKDVETLIAAIGTVTADSGNAVKAARVAYDALTDAQMAEVENYAALTAAEAAYGEIADRIDAVKKLIEEIGTVEYDTAAKIKIDAARKAYDKLSAVEKKYVTNYATLTDAETQYERLKNAQKVIDLIDAIGEVTVDSGEAIAAAREAYDALTAAEKALVTNYAALTAAARKLDALDPEGTTKVIGDGDTAIVIGDVTYMVDEPAAELMQSLDALSKMENPDEQDIIDAYLAYEAMSDDMKAQVFNYDDLEAMTNQLGVKNHRDEDAGMEVDGLDWYVQLEVGEVASGSEYDVVTGSIGSNTLVLLWDINLTNLLTGEKFEPGIVVKVRVKAPDISGFEQIRIAHLLEDGRVEYCACTLEDGYIIWECTSFSCYALIGGRGEAINALDENIPATLTTVQAEQSAPSLAWMWVLIGCLAAAGIAALVVVSLMKRKRAAD